MDGEERIRQRAHEIGEREGRPEGRQQEHWDQAGQETSRKVRKSSAARWRPIPQLASAPTLPPTGRAAEAPRPADASYPKCTWHSGDRSGRAMGLV
ncbi:MULTISPECIES: DUF2934 domain-containing protein [unclassified Mesorhizobium]|nr:MULTISPECIES: DUF2934 domain-containing protein [unclassified Mesorhizobium]